MIKGGRYIMKLNKMKGNSAEKNVNKIKKKANKENKKIKNGINKRTIKGELLFTMLSIATVLTFGIILCVSTILSKYYDNEINSKNEMISNLISKNTSAFMSKAYKLTEELAFNSDIRSADVATKGKVLKESGERNPYFELLYVQDETGMQKGRSSGELADRSDRWWFIQEKNSLSPFISKSYYSISSKNAVTSVFIPLTQENKFTGVMGGDIKLDSLEDLIKENSNEESGRYSFIIDGEGVVVAHSDEEIIKQLYNYKKQTKTIVAEDGSGQATEEPIEVSDGLKEIVAQVIRGYNGSVKFKDKGETYYGSYAPIKLDGNSANWSVITVQKESSAKAIITKVIQVTLIAGIIILIIAGIVIVFVARKISKPIADISGLLTSAATGDFTIKSSTNSKNEIAILSLSFNEMINKVSNLLQNTKSLTNDIKESSIILTDKSDETTNVAREINTTIQEIADGASNQANAADESARLADIMSQEFNQLAEKTDLMIKEALNSAKT